MQDRLVRLGLESRSFAFGGYADAERVRIFILPDYLEGYVYELDEIIAPDLPSKITDAINEAVTAVKICGSGHKLLSHRDHLGSILALGLERDSIGDIAVIDDNSALAITSKCLAEFLLTDLHRVANDVVKVSILSRGESIDIKRELMPINDTVASARLDCIVAALTGISREKAKSLILSGFVAVDYRVAADCDTIISPPTLLTIRGYGKYNVRSFNGTTKKGRLRLCAEKYI